MKRIAAIVALALAFAVPAGAQERYPLMDWEHRGQLSVSTGYLQLEEAGTLKALDLGASATYSLHPLFAAFAIYSHGFALGGGEGENQARLAGNLVLHPAPGSPRSTWGVLAGAGVMWRGTGWNGIETHLTLTGALNPWLGGFASYLHGFAAGDGDQDLDQVRAGLTARVLP